MAEIRQERRYTLLTVFSMVLASAAAVLVGVFAFGLQVPFVMSFAGPGATGGDPRVIEAILYAYTAGPWIAAGALVLGWLVFIAGRPGAGVRLAFFPPVIWAVAVLAYLAIVSTVCGGDPTCGL